jgi:hypothetical protein
MQRCLSILSAFLFLVVFPPCPASGSEVAGAPGPEAGFETIEPVTVNFQYGSYFSRLQLTSSEARVWYSFHPADNSVESRPLFVFFNGGPGSATSCGLMSMYTSRYTLDNGIDSGGGDAFMPNPHSWTRLGNLLYIDARQAGFSYNVTENMSDELTRFQEFNAQNFNPFFDAADFIRVLLRFLDRHPELQKNPVIIVGESYGGTRATAMFHMLLNYDNYANGQEMYQDAGLRDEIQRHFDTVFPESAGTVVPPEVITRQFKGQVLIQPSLAFGYMVEIEDTLLRQPDSLVYRLGQEIGIPYDPAVHGDPLTYVESVAGRDLYIYTKPQGWLNQFFWNAGRLLRFVDQLNRITETNSLAVSELYASARQRAYRVIMANYPDDLMDGWAVPSPSVERLFIRPAIEEASEAAAEPGDMASVFGVLQPWDRYFLSSNGNANSAFHVFNVALVKGYEVSFYMPRYGRMFLQNVAHVPTFVTNAALDLVVYTEALAPALARYDDILESVARETQAGNGEARPGAIILEYRPDAFPGISDIGTKKIRFPLYSSSCHAVSLTQPGELLEDVTAWLEEIGLVLD